MDLSLVVQYGIAGIVLLLIVKPWVENVQARNLKMQEDLLLMHREALNDIVTNQKSMSDSTKLSLNDIGDSLREIAKKPCPILSARVLQEDNGAGLKANPVVAKDKENVA